MESFSPSLLDERKNVLQVSLRRAGSTFLGDLLTSHKEVQGDSGELMSMSTRYSPRDGADRSDPLCPVNHSTAEDYSSETFHRKFTAQDQWYFQNLLGRYQCSPAESGAVQFGKETFMNLHLGWLIKALQPVSLKVLDLRRDFRGVINSYKKMDFIKNGIFPHFMTK